MPPRVVGLQCLHNWPYHGVAAQNAPVLDPKIPLERADNQHQRAFSMWETNSPTKNCQQTLIPSFLVCVVADPVNTSLIFLIHRFPAEVLAHSLVQAEAEITQMAPYLQHQGYFLPLASLWTAESTQVSVSLGKKIQMGFGEVQRPTERDRLTVWTYKSHAANLCRVAGSVDPSYISPHGGSNQMERFPI